VFCGEHRHTLDKEGRLTLPARWRERLGLSVVVTRGLDRCLFVFPSDRFESLALQISQVNLNKSDARQLARYFFCKAIRVEPDKQARITISNDLRAFAGLNGEAVVVGVNDRIEIWEPGRYREVDDALLNDVDAVSERMGDSFPCAA
jgi:MraZ protein